MVNYSYGRCIMSSAVMIAIVAIVIVFNKNLWYRELSSNDSNSSNSNNI